MSININVFRSNEELEGKEHLRVDELPGEVVVKSSQILERYGGPVGSYVHEVADNVGMFQLLAWKRAQLEKNLADPSQHG